MGRRGRSIPAAGGGGRGTGGGGAEGRGRGGRVGRVFEAHRFAVPRGPRRLDPPYGTHTRALLPPPQGVAEAGGGLVVLVGDGPVELLAQGRLDAVDLPQRLL